MNLIAYGVGTQMQYVMVASAGQSDIIMQHAAGGEICQILMSRMEETGAPAAAAGGNQIAKSNWPSCHYYSKNDA